MDNSSFEKDDVVEYANCPAPKKDDVVVYTNCPAPDVIIRQPVTLQPSVMGTSTIQSEHDSKNNAAKDQDGWRENRRSTERTLSVDAEPASRGWASELFFSITGNPHNRSFQNVARRALRDCTCVSCMMCGIATRLGDPVYLPFIPCTGTAVRFKVRILGGITGSICNDCLVTSFCWPCAVCQMHREIEDIGI